ncbi:hypothetical protein RGAI101_3175 [Roseobacter sp. GAI101]|nr:hypothetical protein RGAI101_3175 [Roseobacter sp. GAI101]
MGWGVRKRQQFRAAYSCASTVRVAPKKRSRKRARSPMLNRTSEACVMLR